MACLRPLTTAAIAPIRPGLAPVSRESRAQVAELVDALASGASDLTVVEVRVLSWAPFDPEAVSAARDPSPSMIGAR